MELLYEMNTKLRAEAKNDFKKDFFKLMNNSFLKAQRYQTCNSKQEKKLFSISTKLPHNKMVFRKFTRNEQNES